MDKYNELAQKRDELVIKLNNAYKLADKIREQIRLTDIELDKEWEKKKLYGNKG
jgi:hypothetical protein